MTPSHREQQAHTDTVTAPQPVAECADVSSAYGCGPTAVHAVCGVTSGSTLPNGSWLPGHPDQARPPCFI